MLCIPVDHMNSPLFLLSSVESTEEKICDWCDTCWSFMMCVCLYISGWITAQIGCVIDIQTSVGSEVQMWEGNKLQIRTLNTIESATIWVIIAIERTNNKSVHIRSWCPWFAFAYAFVERSLLPDAGHHHFNLNAA